MQYMLRYSYADEHMPWRNWCRDYQQSTCVSLNTLNTYFATYLSLRTKEGQNPSFLYNTVFQPYVMNRFFYVILLSFGPKCFTGINFLPFWQLKPSNKWDRNIKITLYLWKSCGQLQFLFLSHWWFWRKKLLH